MPAEHSETASIEKIEKQTASNQVYQVIKKNIVSKKWKAGDKLPSEMELAALFGVNRLTVRMALQRLNALGVLDIRVGDGTYVKEFEFSSYLREIQGLYDDVHFLDDVCEFRKLLEVECARLAMDRATAEDLRELERLCVNYEQLKSEVTLPVEGRTLRLLAEADIAFHFQICRMSHNDLYIHSYAMAKDTICKYVALMLKKRTDRWNTRRISLLEGDFRHRAILEAIRAHDFSSCKKLFYDMIDHNIEL